MEVAVELLIRPGTQTALQRSLTCALTQARASRFRGYRGGMLYHDEDGNQEFRCNETYWKAVTLIITMPIGLAFTAPGSNSEDLAAGPPQRSERRCANLCIAASTWRSSRIKDRGFSIACWANAVACSLLPSASAAIVIIAG